MLVSSAVESGFNPRSVQTKDYIIVICFFSTVLKSKSMECHARNQDNVSEWSDMSTRRTVVSVSYNYTNPSKGVGLVQSGYHQHHLIEM